MTELAAEKPADAFDLVGRRRDHVEDQLVEAGVDELTDLVQDLVVGPDDGGRGDVGTRLGAKELAHGLGFFLGGGGDERAEPSRPDRRRIASFALAVPAEHVEQMANLVGIAEEVAAIGVPGHESERAPYSRSADQDRWTAGSHGGRHVPGVLDAVVAAGEGGPVSYTHLRAHETDSYIVCRLL